MQDSDNDLHRAIALVRQRIEEQAFRSGEPLGQDLAFLSDLPHSASWIPSLSAELPDVRVRDRQYERLCALAKEAYIHQLAASPEAAPDWHIAAAILELKKHPMARLLKWAGVKQQRPWWDQWLLLVAGVVFAAFLVGGFAVEAATPSLEARVAIVCVYALVVLALYGALQGMQRRQLKSLVKRLRPSSTYWLLSG